MMEYQPTKAPIYGGGVLLLQLHHPGDRDHAVDSEIMMEFVPNDRLFLVLEGRTEMHIATLKHSHNVVWSALIPGHNRAEHVKLCVMQRLSSGLLLPVADGHFQYFCDSTMKLAHFLISSVNKSSALNTVELIRTDEFDLAEENLSTLDEQLSLALKHLPLPSGWSVLGIEPHETSNVDLSTCRETLLHFTARLGLMHTAMFLLNMPGSEEALTVLNHEKQMPHDVAVSCGFPDLAILFSGYNTSGMFTQVTDRLVLNTSNGALCIHGDLGSTITTSRAVSNYCNIEGLISTLCDEHSSTGKGMCSSLLRHYQTDWPSPSPGHKRKPSTSILDCGLLSEEAVHETMTRIMHQHHDHLVGLVKGFPSDFISTESCTAAAHSPQQLKTVSVSCPCPRLTPDVIKAASQKYGVLEGSLHSTSAVTEGLFQLMDCVALAKRKQRTSQVRRCRSLSHLHLHLSCLLLNRGAVSGQSPWSPSDDGKYLHNSTLVLTSPPCPSDQTPSLSDDAMFSGNGDVSCSSSSPQNVPTVVSNITDTKGIDSGGCCGLVDDYSELDVSRDGSSLALPVDGVVRRNSWCPETSLQAFDLDDTAHDISAAGLDLMSGSNSSHKYADIHHKSTKQASAVYPREDRRRRGSMFTRIQHTYRSKKSQLSSSAHKATNGCSVGGGGGGGWSKLKCPSETNDPPLLRHDGVSVGDGDEPDHAACSDACRHDQTMDSASVMLGSVSSEFAVDASFLDDEPDLQLRKEERDMWSVTVDKKILKKMIAKEIKRQDTIWELIQTERQFVSRLRIMQKVFRDPMLLTHGLPVERVGQLFPQLDDLYDIHSTFLRSLLSLQSSNTDSRVDEIGPTLLNQFSSLMAERMMLAYGVFCSRHTEAIQVYKCMMKTESKFQLLCKNASMLGLCEKRELPDFLLGVTLRLSKYPILVEAILKSTKEKSDRDHLIRALSCCRHVVHGVDKEVAAYERLMDIYRSFDSRTTVYMGRKFKRSDLIGCGRRLLHAGYIGWKSVRNRVLETYTLVLTDIMVFLQKSEQKYSFLLLDNKACVVPLWRLLVREKCDERGSHGIYVISQKHSEPEMYELVCRSRGERDIWITVLSQAIDNCPEGREEHCRQNATPLTELTAEEEVVRQGHELKNERRRRIKSIIEQLHAKDDEIRRLCEEKNRLLHTLIDLSLSGKHDVDTVTLGHPPTH